MKMTNYSNNISTLGILILSLSLSFNSINSIKISEAQESSSVTGDQIKTPTISPKQIPQNNNLEYKNSTYGIRLLYPNDWIPLGHNNNGNTNSQVHMVVAFLSVKSILNSTIKSPVLLSVLAYDLPLVHNTTLNDYTWFHLRHLSNYEFMYLKPTLLAGYPAYETAYVDKNKDVKVTEIWTIIDNNDKAYQIGYFAKTANYERYLPNARRMINSFEILSNMPK